MIKTKSISDPTEAGNGERILVSRYWPKGIDNGNLPVSAWMRNLSPSVELLDVWRNGQITWDEYVERFKTEMEACQDAIRELARRAEHKTITLICHEPEHAPHCHRHILRHMIEFELQRKAE